MEEGIFIQALTAHPRGRHHTGERQWRCSRQEEYVSWDESCRSRIRVRRRELLKEDSGFSLLKSLVDHLVVAELDLGFFLPTFLEDFNPILSIEQEREKAAMEVEKED
ncbi:hypothetical protein KSP40_PGU007120 [Platanthera guangdongensis]|uniref:Uncharacterized protein n=1 Tax=Platanthera guangdongensis TaxID=2320717 RepID=A0ABR2MKE6_9ASPA